MRIIENTTIEHPTQGSYCQIDIMLYELMNDSNPRVKLFNRLIKEDGQVVEFEGVTIPIIMLKEISEKLTKIAEKAEWMYKLEIEREKDIPF